MMYRQELLKLQAHCRSRSKSPYKPKMEYFYSLSSIMDHVFSQRNDHAISDSSSSDEDLETVRLRISNSNLNRETCMSSNAQLQSNKSWDTPSTSSKQEDMLLASSSNESDSSKRKKISSSNKKNAITPHLGFSDLQSSMSKTPPISSKHNETTFDTNSNPSESSKYKKISSSKVEKIAKPCLNFINLQSNMIRNAPSIPLNHHESFLDTHSNPSYNRKHKKKKNSSSKKKKCIDSPLGFSNLQSRIPPISSKHCKTSLGTNSNASKSSKYKKLSSSKQKKCFNPHLTLFKHQSNLSRDTPSTSSNLQEIPLDTNSTVSESSRYKKKKTFSSENKKNINPLLKLKCFTHQSNMDKDAPSTSSNNQQIALDLSSNASECSKHMKMSSSKEKTINPHLNFFKSLLPYMEAFSPIEALKVRSDIQNIVHLHYRDKLSNGIIRDYDYDRTTTAMPESRCESRSGTTDSQHNSPLVLGSDHSTSQMNVADVPLPVGLIHNNQYKQNSNYDIAPLNDFPGGTFNTNTKRQTIVHCSRSHHENYNTRRRVSPLKQQRTTNVGTAVDARVAAEQYLSESENILEHSRYSNTGTYIKSEAEECIIIDSDHDSDMTVKNCRQIVPKVEPCEENEDIHNLLKQLPSCVTVKCHPLIKNVNNQLPMVNINTDENGKFESEDIDEELEPYEDEDIDIEMESFAHEDAEAVTYDNEAVSTAYKEEAEAMAYEDKELKVETTDYEDELEGEVVSHKDSDEIIDIETVSNATSYENEEFDFDVNVDGKENLQVEDSRLSRCNTHNFSPVVLLTRLEDLLGLDDASVSDLQSFYMF